jgi:hypothetical protein
MAKKKKIKKDSAGKAGKSAKRKPGKKKKSAPVTKRTARKPAKVKALAGLYLYDFVINPRLYTISVSPQSVTITGHTEFRGNDAKDVFVVRIRQPQSPKWRITSPLEVRFNVQKVGRKNLEWVITLECTGPKNVRETFQVVCTGFLESKPDSSETLQQTIQVQVV